MSRQHKIPDSEIAGLAREWLDGATQASLAQRYCLSQGAISMKIRAFICKYEPKRSFGYAECRKVAVKSALAAFRKAHKK